MKKERQVHRKSLLEWGRRQPETVVISGDLTAACEADGFAETYPDRFINMGMMEQNMISFAAGLAREGLVPLVHTFGVFMYRRALDQVEMSVSYADLPVRMFGFLPGVTTPGGPSHQATNDVAVLRSLPNMSVIEVGDAADIESLYSIARSVSGPLYVRMLRGEVSRVFDTPFALNRARVLSTGTDVVLLTSGVCTEEALRATDLIREAGMSIAHLHVTTLKPFDDPTLFAAISNCRLGVITMENHTTIGGLGSCVADVISAEGIGRRLIKIGLNDRYLQGASAPYLMKNYGMGAEALVAAVESLSGQRLGITPDQLAASEVSDFVGENQLEAL